MFTTVLLWIDTLVVVPKVPAVVKVKVKPLHYSIPLLLESAVIIEKVV